MQEITVTIKWNEPDEPFWLNADNIKMALSTYCQNTTFEVEASRDSRILSAVPSEEDLGEWFRNEANCYTRNIEGTYIPAFK